MTRLRLTAPAPRREHPAWAVILLSLGLVVAVEILCGLIDHWRP